MPENRPARSSAVQAGIICLGIGVLSFWLFGLGFLFFGITFICGVVAMCTYQVKEGLMLIFAAILSMWGCLVLFFMFFVGMFAALLGGVVKQVSSLPAPTGHASTQTLQQQAAGVQTQAHNALNPLFHNIRTNSPSNSSTQFDAEAAKRRKELNDLRRRQGSPEAPEILFGGGNSR